ncbi:hypothetical protein, partial [Enterococcus faecium]|uniref:hypothetical protein n=1 Tax=Enterococcus faecium TaxID=1352 RepID=UPI003AAD32C7
METKKIITIISLLVFGTTQAQTKTKTPSGDTTATSYLPDITVVGKNSKSDYQQMPQIVGTNIYAGKKNALIVLDNVQGNV